MAFLLNYPLMNDTVKTEAGISDQQVESMFKAGAHFGFGKSRRHPSTKPYIFGIKNNVEIFDLEKTKPMLEKAKDFVKGMASRGEVLLFVGGKFESLDTVKNAAMTINMPYVSGRWVGGTITNWSEIKKRIDLLATMTKNREIGEYEKYTKKERLMLDRDMKNLAELFSGISSMTNLPKALFVVDPKREITAVNEAKQKNIPVIALAGSDCDISDIDYPIPGNDSSIMSIKFFVSEIAKAYEEGKKIK